MNSPTTSDDYSNLVYPTSPVSRRSFSIEEEFYEYARRLGNGNASKGLRVALAYHARHTHERAGQKRAQ